MWNNSLGIGIQVCVVQLDGVKHVHSELAESQLFVVFEREIVGDAIIVRLIGCKRLNFANKIYEYIYKILARLPLNASCVSFTMKKIEPVNVETAVPDREKVQAAAIEPVSPPASPVQVPVVGHLPSMEGRAQEESLQMSLSHHPLISELERSPRRAP